jgi:hypothetical protein
LKVIPLSEIFRLTDEEFCEQYNISLEELNAKKSKKGQKEEKDVLWAYVPEV